MAEKLFRYTTEHLPRIVTAGGWARSGKGTSMAHLKDTLEQKGRSVTLIDQGIKFRVMGEVAIEAGQPLDSPAVLQDFLRTGRARKATLTALKEIAVMDEAAKKARLYVPAISKASGQVGQVPSAHEVAVGLLRDQVREAAGETDIILIDGRSIEQYAQQFSEEGLARFVMGWFFKCDPVIAARRSLGLFGKIEDLTQAEKDGLLNEASGISERNSADTQRDVDPLREPVKAYHLDLSTYYLPGSDVPYKRARDVLAHRHGVAVVDTSYTHSIEEMTNPITAISMFALLHRGGVTHQDVGIQVIHA